MLVDKNKNNFLRGYISKDNNDPINFAQDPTYLSFSLDFFPSDTNVEYGVDKFLAYSYAHDSLFKAPKISKTDSRWKDRFSNYDFRESAQDYLYSIGSLPRLASLESFIKLLTRIQKETPWYFQKVSGTEALYTIDPAVNTIKDGVLTVECLESIDLRSSLLADLYRNAAWDFERKREVLPYNMRTFRMYIHIFEMRNFKKTLGDFYTVVDSGKEAALTGVIDPNITVRTYELGQCEFDFFSQAPNYMTDLSVADVPMASFSFKIKFKTVKMSADYSFYKYVIDHISSLSQYPYNSAPFTSGIVPDTKDHAYASYDLDYRTSLKKYERIIPGRNPGGIMGSVLGALESRVNTAVNNVVSSAEGMLMGNVYDQVPSVNEISQAMLGFFNPDLGLPGKSYTVPIREKMGNVYEERDQNGAEVNREDAGGKGRRPVDPSNVYDRTENTRINTGRRSNVYDDRVINKNDRNSENGRR